MKFNWKLGKNKWLILLAVGMLLLILAIPSDPTKLARKTTPETKSLTELKDGIVTEPADSAAASVKAEKTYEEQMEQRVRQILKNVDGVGTVDVMIVLKSSEEKVLRVDRNTSDSSTDEQDNTGGTRKITSAEKQEATILTGSGDSSMPIVEKELRPEIEGVVISCQGGASPTVKVEISSAMEALFNLPPHKIKVLKRVE